MSFLYPQFLYGLFAAAVPIAIHLFNLRRHKTVYFSDTSLLKNIQKKTQSTSRLRHWLTLLTRILFIVFLTAAFAQPYFENGGASEKSEKRHFSLYIDNSLSMGVKTPEGVTFDRARQKAFNIADELKPADDIRFLSNRFSARDELALSKVDLIPLIEELQTGSHTQPFSKVIARQALTSGDGSRSEYNFIISDFQTTFWDPENFDAETGNAKTYLLPVKSAGQKNLAIDSVWFSSPVRKKGQKDSVFVRLLNTDENEVVQTNIELFINGALQSVMTAEAAPGKSDTVMYFNVKNTGEHHGEVRIKDGAAAFDNALFFRFRVPETFKVLEIAPERSNRSPVKRVFDDAEFFDYQFAPQSDADLSNVSDHALIVLNEVTSKEAGLWSELRAYAEKGGAVMILPAKDAVSPLTDFLQKLNAGSVKFEEREGEIAEIEYEHPVFSGVFTSKPKNPLMPGYEMFFAYRPGTVGYETAARTKDGRPALTEIKVEAGRIYLWSVNLSSSNLAGNTIWLPALYRMAFLSQPNEDLYKTIGKNAVFELGNSNIDRASVSVTDPGSQTTFRPEVIPAGRSVLINMHGQVERPGVYAVEGKGGKLLRYAAFNFPREESHLKFVSADELAEDIERFNLAGYEIWEGDTDRIKAGIQQLETQNTLWKWCIAGALFFLGLEILFLRFIK